MKKQEMDDEVRKLAGHIGGFIRYWGFRRIHGQIWALVYLSETALSGAELVERLGVSKALVSPALRELEDEGLIKRVVSENSKVKRYVAVEDVEKVIKGVLRRRERPMLAAIGKSYSAVQRGVSETSDYRPDRIEEMGAMIQMAELGLDYLLQTDVKGFHLGLEVR